MNGLGKTWSANGSRRPRRRAFTFIELIVAVGLSVILLRGMYTVLHSATDLTTLSEERMSLLQEASAIFDYIGADLARVPFSGQRYFNVASTPPRLILKATSRTGGDDVYIKYECNAGEKKVVRGVYKDQGCTIAVDDDGDGHNDVGMVIGRSVQSFEVKYHASGDINLAHRPGVRPPFVRFQLGDNLHSPNLGGTGDRAGGEAGTQSVKLGKPFPEFALNMRYQVHDVGVALNLHELGDLNGAGLADSANIIAGKVYQHDVFGSLFFVILELFFKGFILMTVLAAGSGAGDGVIGDHAILNAYQKLGRSPHNMEVAQVEEIHIGRGINRAQGAVYGKGAGIGTTGQPL